MKMKFVVFCLLFASLSAPCCLAEVRELVTFPDGVRVTVRADGGEARISVERTDDAAVVKVVGAAVTNAVCEIAGETPAALVYGNGWYIEEPGRLVVPQNGHHNGTSFDAFTLRNGVSVLMAATAPIESLFVRPDEKRFGLQCLEETTFTILTSRKGLFATAFLFRDKYDRRTAAAGVRAKAGKFCVDVWNGRYAQHAEFIERAAKEYGLRDDLIFYSHNYQRWGYDYRLPDVWPPNPRFGTRAEMQRCLETAKKYGWGFGLHLNTSDFYDDASDFSFRRVAYTKDGKPEKAWYNAFMKAQSYRMAYDYAPVSMGNVLKTMNNDGFSPDTMFVDVIGSHPAASFYDESGKFHRRSEAAAKWGEVFDIIRETQTKRLGRQAYTASEGVCDYLMGHLDGGDCQWMVLGTEADEYRWIRIGSARRIVKVPWFDAVNHSRFSLHGAGYSIRFEGGRGEDCHGLDSDDYLSVELLAGHALMTDAYSRDVRDVSAGIICDFDVERVLRQVSRHYYLAQHVAREIAVDDMASVEWADGDPARTLVTWKGGMRIWVNRGETDWTVADGVILPTFGFYAKSAKTGAWAKIARFTTTSGTPVVAEASECRKTDGTLQKYANARGQGTPGLIPFTPRAEVTAKDRGTLSVKLSFDRFACADRVLPEPAESYDVSLWLVRRKTTENANTLPDYRLLREPASVLKPFERTVKLPLDVDGRYDLLVSLIPAGQPVENPFEAKDRVKLLGTPSFFRRYRLGTYDVGPARFTPFVQKDAKLWPRLFAPQSPVDFGWIKTRDAVLASGDQAPRTLWKK